MLGGQTFSDNPALLKLALFCKGLRLSEDALTALGEGREIVRTRAGLGSGLELILGEDMYTNAPVTEWFCKASPFELIYEDGSYFVTHEDGKKARVRPSPRPVWYDSTTRSGRLMRRVGTLQGTYLGIFPTKVCDFWREQEQCLFCSVGLNLGADDADEKTLADVLEVVEAAREQSGITYVDFNTGHYRGETYLDALEPLVAAVKKQTGLLVGVQTPPHGDLSRYRRLRDMGVNRVSFCFELYDKERFSEICPGKSKVYGLERYLEAMDYCVTLGAMKNPGEPWVTNGELIAGLEEPSVTIAAIDRIVEVGAIPTVCVFRPLTGTAFARLAPPKLDAMLPVFRHLYEACMQHDLPIGLAPNVHVSLVMLPEECALLSPKSREASFRWKQWKLNLKKAAFRFQFNEKQYDLDHCVGRGPLESRFP
jgi:hypothetical protein